MKHYFLVGLFTIIFMLGQKSYVHAQKLITKLYDDKETVRGGKGPKLIKQMDGSQVEGPQVEEEFFYKESKSSLFPASGKCFIQYYHSYEKVTLIVNDKVTADVILDGLDDLHLDINQEFFWHMYDRFIFKSKPLSYKKVGERKSDGMHKVVLFMNGKNINKFLKRYLTVQYLRINETVPKWYAVGSDIRSKQWENNAYHSGSPLWLHRNKASWLPKAYTEAIKQN